jgi:hypothetical protein
MLSPLSSACAIGDDGRTPWAIYFEEHHRGKSFRVRIPCYLGLKTSWLSCQLHIELDRSALQKGRHQRHIKKMTAAIIIIRDHAGVSFLSLHMLLPSRLNLGIRDSGWCATLRGRGCLAYVCVDMLGLLVVSSFCCHSFPLWNLISFSDFLLENILHNL